MDDDKINEARDRLIHKVESLMEAYAQETAEHIKMPVLGDWVLVFTVDDVTDPRCGGRCRITPLHQWMHKTIGLLSVVADEYRRDTESGSK